MQQVVQVGVELTVTAPGAVEISAHDEPLLGRDVLLSSSKQTGDKVNRTDDNVAGSVDFVAGSLDLLHIHEHVLI